MQHEICPIGCCIAVATLPSSGAYPGRPAPREYSLYAMEISAAVRICRQYFKERFRTLP
jgi:hypothetical protein